MKKILFLFAILFSMALAQTAMAQTWGPCPEDASKQCVYMGSPSPQITLLAAPATPPVTATSSAVPPSASPPTSLAPPLAVPAAPSTVTPTNWWPWIIGLIAALAISVLIWLIRRGDRRIREAHLQDEIARRRAARLRLENEIIAAEDARDRHPSSRTEQRLMWAQIALHRHDHPDEPVVDDGHVQIAVARGHGNITGAPFLGGPVVAPPAAQLAPAAANP